MYPTLHLGKLGLSTYVLWRATAVVVLLTLVLAIRLRRKERPFSARDLVAALPALLLGLTLGSWLEYILPVAVAHVVHGDPFPAAWWLERRWLGALGGASLAGYLYCRGHNLPVGRSFDLFAAPLPLALSVGRIGCLMAGCCYGREATTWPAILLPDTSGFWARRYPTQIADSLFNLLIAITLGIIAHRADRGRSKLAEQPGAQFLLFVLLHCGQRFLVEFWRADTPRLYGPFTWSHLYSALGLALAAWLMWRRRSS